MQTTPRASAVLACLAVLAASAPAAGALSLDQRKCQEAVAKEGGKFVKVDLKERARCANKNLSETGSCDLAKRDAKLDKAESKLRAAIDKKCGLRAFGGGSNVPVSLKNIGFPGKCRDTDASNGFTDDDLEDCIFDTHSAVAWEVFDLQFGANGADSVQDFGTQTGNASTAKRLSRCQESISENGRMFLLTVLEAIQECRNALNADTLSDFPPSECDVTSPTADKIAQATSEAVVRITAKCTVTDIQLLDVCSVFGPPPLTVGDAIACILASHREAVDQLIAIEYPEPGVCGDDLVNDPLQSVIGSLKLGAPPEECDGVDDGPCHGDCGSPTGNFACLCTDVPRERTIEHDNADLDNGWTGTSHDSTIVEGGGYLVDLYDCDGPSGPDTLCTVGPSCNVEPHQPCVADSDCAGVGNFCRRRTTAAGPYCNLDVEQACAGDGDCPGLGNFCRKSPHGIPLPLSSGGIAVCVLNVFSEDITGTTDLATGSFAANIRQSAVTHLVGGTLNQPCPSCGGFCNGVKEAGSPSGRTLCQADADCEPGVVCIHDAVCSFGPNQDQLCRRDPPFGNDTALMGTPSVDCPPPPGANISGAGLAIHFNPLTSGTVTLLPSYPCNASGFDGKACVAGANTGRPCTADGDCGGIAGSCRHQCFCPAVGGVPQKPNECDAACRGGTNDYQSCPNGDADCPGGFCQQASCRAASGVCTSGTAIGAPCVADSDCPGNGTCGDDDSSGEGFCPAGPLNGLCSFTSTKGCLVDGDCHRPACPFCLASDTETCVFAHRNCFVNEGIVRNGQAGVPDRVGVAVFCIPQSGAPGVDPVAGLPGPAALEASVTTVLTGF